MSHLLLRRFTGYSATVYLYPIVEIMSRRMDLNTYPRLNYHRHQPKPGIRTISRVVYPISLRKPQRSHFRFSYSSQGFERERDGGDLSFNEQALQLRRFMSYEEFIN